MIEGGERTKQDDGHKSALRERKHARLNETAARGREARRWTGNEVSKATQLSRGNPVQREASVRPAMSFAKTRGMPRTTTNSATEGVKS